MPREPKQDASCAIDAASWYEVFRTTLRRPTWASQLASAADGARLRLWTELLTAVVVEACRGLGLRCAAKGIGDRPLPIPREEYLGVDVLAFPAGEGWRSPVAAFELENAQRDEAVAYALWKLCTVACPFRCLLCYRRVAGERSPLLRLLSEAVLRNVSPEGEILVVVGTRAAASTFPDGYFRPFRWEPRVAELRPFTGSGRAMSRARR